MSNENSSEKGARYLLSNAIRSFDGCSYWWRDWLDEIEHAVNTDDTRRRDTVQSMVEIVRLARYALAACDSINDAAIKQGLRHHNELALKETFERAEKLGLPLSHALRKSSSEGPHGPGRCL